MSHRHPLIAAGAFLVALAASAGAIAQSAAPSGPVYSAAQAERARSVYATTCAACHGPDLGGAQFAPPLRGISFRNRWAARPVAELYEYTRTMPPGGARSLSDSVYADLVALMLRENGVEPGAHDLPSDLNALQAMVMPGQPALAGQQRALPGGGLTPGVRLPFWPARPNPLDKLQPVTDALLADPPEGSWLHWRRTYDGKGFSPLTQINKNNVKDLRVAWSLALPPGPNAATPLVHDGVIFVHAYRDNVLALDAKTGDLLWHYARQLPEGVTPSVKRNMAIYGEKLYVGTSDVHVVALDVKTGRVVWDKAIGDRSKGDVRLSGGPVIARGKVMQGTVGRLPGGAYIAALDAETGEEAWRFYSIARPDEPGGNSWNDLPLEARNGGSLWTSGYYDPQTNLVFFGPAPTYDTGPLRNPVKKRGVTNDALYTNATIALNPDTGKLVWHFQHVKNDQWDYDWTFERHIIELPDRNGGTRRLVVTGGKQGVFDAMDVATGKYAFSFDLGIQNLISGIDPKTGEKKIDPKLVPGDGERKTICPHAGGGKSWVPSSYNPGSRVLFVPSVETCMDLTPVGEGERGSLSTGVRWTIRPRPDSDGKYGRLQAVDVQTGKTLWVERQRTAFTSGILATAGGVVFAGSLDRWLKAYDEATGKVLWQTQLTDVPSAAPITYTIDGKQYVAMIAGFGSAHAATFPVLTPEIAMPVSPSSAIWVFALP